jgi:uncharacterized repeat protein (TIGR02543 family)
MEEHFMTNTDVSPFATVVVGTEAELRNAVNAAETGDVIQVVGTIGLPAQLVVPADKNITIAGLTAGATLQYTGAAGANGRVISNSGTLTLENIIITGGNTTESGGGIYTAGRLTLNGGTVVTNNQAIGTLGTLGKGGGIYSERTTLILNGDAAITLNTASFGGGGIYNYLGNVTFNDNSRVAENECFAYGGGMYNQGGTAKLNDYAIFTLNDASGNADGGGIFSDATLEMYGHSAVTNNKTSGGRYGAGIASTGSLSMNDYSVVSYNLAGTLARPSSGGGIYASGGHTTLNDYASVMYNTALSGGGINSSIENILTLNGHSSVHGNRASTLGGGINAHYTFKMSAYSSVTDNTAGSNGGGIYLNGNIPFNFTANINGDASITGNTSGNNGGGIYIPYSQLDKLNVAAGVIFANNKAATAYLINPDDIPLYNAHIHSRVFTVPFKYGYNNYDISYTNGELREVVTVSYDSNGGTPVDSQILLSGDPVSEPPDPTLPGYIFAGWYVDPELTILWDFIDPVTSDMTLYAKWEQELPGTFTVNFDSNGGTPVPPQDVNAGNALIPPVEPNRNCDIFDGWYIDPELTIPWNFSDPVTENMTLYARWIPRDCPEPPCPPCPPCPPYPPYPLCPPCVILCRPQCCYQQKR